MPKGKKDKTLKKFVAAHNNQTNVQTNLSLVGINNRLNLLYTNLFEGLANNVNNPLYGGANLPLLRKTNFAYADGISTLAVRGTKNPNPRVVSNSICKQTTSIPNANKLTDMCWLFGQFIDHELDLTTTGTETANMTTSDSDPNEAFPNCVIPFSRSVYMTGSRPRQQPNQVTSYIDCSNVYGSDIDRNDAMRLLDGTGKMKTTLANNGETIPPRNLNGLPNSVNPFGSDPTTLFLVGDIRGNENIMLTAMHTLFIREHNRLCSTIVQNYPDLINQDDLIFQKARNLLIGTVQHIVYNELIPALLGHGAIPPYSGYNPNINVGTTIEFSTVAYRIGHTMLSSSLKIDGNGGTLLLRNGFFNPTYIAQHGVNNLLLGSTLQVMQEIDGQLVDDVRDFLFGPVVNGHVLDLASLNIQRSRDHGIPGYNAVRLAFGLSPKTHFTDITTNTTVSNKLAALYNTPNDIDPWIGALVEDHYQHRPVGELVYTILVDQFTRARDGDRFWFENNANITYDERYQIYQTKLADVIRRNTNWTTQIRDDVFHLY
jgi:peroxidase